MQGDLILRTSGIRGKANYVISPELAVRVGRAFAKWILGEYPQGPYYVYVGYDTRRNSYNIAQCVIAALLSCGINVIQFDKPVPTPLVIHATTNNQSNGGVMITGSHLPAEDNGIILFDHQGSYYKGLLPDSDFKVSWDKLGKHTIAITEIDEYRLFLHNLINKLDVDKSNIRVIMDTAHGPMADYLRLVLDELCLEVIKVNDQFDDSFPGRHSEPTPENIEETRKMVVELQCDLGITTDMDGDRVIFITGEGEVVTGDYFGAILSSMFWQQDPGSSIVAPVNTSGIIDIVAEINNGKIIKCDVGPPSIINALRENNAVFGFEETGKYMFPDTAIWPDAAISTIFLFKMLKERAKNLHEIYAELPVLHSIKSKVEVSREDTKAVMDRLVTSVDPEKTLGEWIVKIAGDNMAIISDLSDLMIININSQDGIRLDLEDNAYLMIRPSGTESYIRVFSEHKQREMTEKLQLLGEDLIRFLN